MSKCRVRSILKSNVRYWTLLPPKYWALRRRRQREPRGTQSHEAQTNESLSASPSPPPSPLRRCSSIDNRIRGRRNAIGRCKGCCKAATLRRRKRRETTEMRNRAAVPRHRDRRGPGPRRLLGRRRLEDRRTQDPDRLLDGHPERGALAARPRLRGGARAAAGRRGAGAGGERRRRPAEFAGREPADPGHRRAAGGAAQRAHRGHHRRIGAPLERAGASPTTG